VPTSRGHDHLLISTALTARLDEIGWRDRMARGSAATGNSLDHGVTLIRTITLPCESWRAVIAVLREKALPYRFEHADHREWQLEQHGPGEPTVRLSLTDDVFLRSDNWVRWQLGILLPVEGWASFTAQQPRQTYHIEVGIGKIIAS
jgi:hypothetical protein